MEILFEFKEVKDIVDVSTDHYGDKLKTSWPMFFLMYFSTPTG